MPEPKRTPLYQITVEGRLNERWTSWFDGMSISCEDDLDQAPLTVLTGPVVDQASLRGLLTKVWDLGLELITVSRVFDESTEQNSETCDTLNRGQR